MTKQIDILVVEPGRAPQVAQAENTLETFEQIIGVMIGVDFYLPGNAGLPGERETGWIYCGKIPAVRTWRG